MPAITARPPVLYAKLCQNAHRRLRSDLKQKLASVLQRWAVEEWQQVIKDEEATLAKKLEVTKIAYQRLQEARRLAPNASEVIQCSNIIASDLSKMRKEQEVIDDYGTIEVYQIQQQAVRAYNDDRHADAIRLLRQAIDINRRSIKLKQELAMILSGNGSARPQRGGTISNLSRVRTGRKNIDRSDNA